MDTIGAFEAKTHFSELLERAARGEVIQITKHGHPVARLVPSLGPDPARVARAATRLKKFHEDMPEVPLQEILDARHEDHRF